jgi:hypothetical protein
MTIANERLVDYLGLEFELCYLKSNGQDAVWILADKIRRKDDIAIEMLRLFHRWTRIAKSLDRVNDPSPPLQLPDRDGVTINDSPTKSSHNGPYMGCIGVRIRIKEHIASCHVRPGIDVSLVAKAPRLSSGVLLSPNFDLSVDDPIVQLLAKVPSIQPPRNKPPSKS